MTEVHLYLWAKSRYWKLWPGHVSAANGMPPTPHCHGTHGPVRQHCVPPPVLAVDCDRRAEHAVPVVLYVAPIVPNVVSICPELSRAGSSKAKARPSRSTPCSDAQLRVGDPSMHTWVVSLLIVGDDPNLGPRCPAPVCAARIAVACVGGNHLAVSAHWRKPIVPQAADCEATRATRRWVCVLRPRA